MRVEAAWPSLRWLAGLNASFAVILGIQERCRPSTELWLVNLPKTCQEPLEIDDEIETEPETLQTPEQELHNKELLILTKYSIDII